MQTREDLARELTALRSGSGWTVRDLARKLGSPAATLGDYFSGRHLPGPRQLGLYRRILAECGVSDQEQVDRWLAALARARRASDGRAAKGLAPYRGLDPFRESDAELFFGRGAAVEELLARLRDLRDDPISSGGTVALVGPSGSGKSSLLMAGLLPAINGGALDEGGTRWVARCITPDQLPQVAPDADPTPPPRRTVLIVDQFEEALTLPDGRRAELLHRLQLLQEQTLVVVGIRADFYQEAAAETALLPALRHSQVLLGPMTVPQLREAVLGPARRVGVAVEEGLVDLVLADLAPGGPPGFAHDPGALPLLSYALLATWDGAGQNRLTVAGYLAVGGLRGAVRQAAEELYQSLTEPEREVARALFARLVRLDRDGPPTRRRARRAELLETGDPGWDQDARAVMERFVAARLLTAAADTVQISHETLLGAWPRLGEWVESDREWLRLHHQLSDAADVWSAAGRDESLLWAGARLVSASEQADQGGAPGRQLSRIEREFLGASVHHRDRQLRAERRRARRTQQLLGVVGLLAATAIVLAVVAVSARNGAERARDQALSRQVAVEADDLSGSQPSLAAELAVAAYRIAPTVQARSALVDATAGAIPTRLLGPAGPEFDALSGDGRLLAVAQSGTDTVAIYNRSSGPPARVAEVAVGSPANQDYAIAMSPAGHLLAVGGTDRRVGLWDLARPAHPTRLATLTGFNSTVYSLAFSPDGRHLAGAGADGTVRQWTVTDPRRPVPQPVLAAPGGVPLKAVAYSPDGRRLAAAGGTGTLAVWTLGDPNPQVATTGADVSLQSVGFSPDGTRVGAGGSDGNLRVWSVSGHGPMRLATAALDAATAELNCSAFSLDGSLLAAGSSDGTVRVYDTRSWSVAETLQMPNPVTSVAFTPGGHHLVSSASGGETRIWALPTPASYTEPGNIFSLDYAYGGRLLAVTTSGAAGQVTTWDVTGPSAPRRIGPVADPPGFGPVAGAGAVSPDGRLLAAADPSGRVQLFGLAADGTAHPVGPPLTGSKPHVEQLSFTHHGRILVAGDDGSQIRLWDVSRPDRPVLLSTTVTGSGEVLGFSIGPADRLLAAGASDNQVRLYDISHPDRPVPLATVGGFGSYVFDTAISPDGRTLIAGSADGTIRLWDITDPVHPRLLGRPLSGPEGDVFQLAVSPDGRTLAAATTAHSVWLWDMANRAAPRLLETLGAARDSVFAVSFSPDGGVLAAGGSDRTLHFWDYRPATAIQRVCSMAGTPITRPEWARYIQGAPYRPPCR